MQRISHVVPSALVELLRGTPLSDGKARFAWQVVVGPALDRATAVKLEAGVLVVETTNAQWAREVRRSASVILGRLEKLLGPAVVTSISIREHPRR